MNARSDRNHWTLEEVVEMLADEFDETFIRSYFTTYPDYLHGSFSSERLREIARRARDY